MAGFTFRGKARAPGAATRRQLRLSRAALAAERIAHAFWPAFSFACMALACALFGGFLVLPGIWHGITLAGVTLGLSALIAFGLWRFHIPSRTAAARRLDRTDPSRPLATLSDQLATGREASFTRSVWQAHQRKAEAAAERLRAMAPDLRLARYDHWALRLVAPALVVGGFIGAGDSWPDRLASMFSPQPVKNIEAGTPTRVPMAEAWASPPSYTGFDTVYLNDTAQGEPVRLPVGSELTVRVTDFDGSPELKSEGLTGFSGFTGFGAGLAEARAVVTASGRIEVIADHRLAEWTIEAIPDEPPEIALAQPLRGTVTGSLEVVFEARDDYGVTAAWVEIRPKGQAAGAQTKGLSLEPITFALPLPISGDPREVADSTIEDLSAHPWAGAEVEMLLFAEDGAGQQTRIGPIAFRLPARRFTHPLARSLVEERRHLALDFGQAERVLDVVQAVTRRPEAIFGDKHGAYLTTRTAIRRLADALVNGHVPETAPEVIEFLWLAALNLDGGDLSSALDQLRTAEQKLRDALENGSEADIARAIEELRAAMQNYLQEMARRALEQQRQDGNQPQQGDQQGQQMTQQDLEEMLNELQRRAEGGLRDQARNMLSELSRMLDNLQAGRQQPGQQGGAGKTMQQLQELIERQRDLSDRTFGEMRRQRRGQGQDGLSGQPRQGQRPGGEGLGQGNGSDGQQGQQGGLAGDQEALRQLLDELARRIPGGPGTGDLRRALDDAERAMGDARDNLQKDQNNDALKDQMEALDRLNEGAGALAEAIRNGQGDVRARGEGRGNGEGRDGEDIDPFDRPAGTFGAIDGRSTGVPDRSTLDRARELLDELRRRSAETFRPELELDYLDRLMDQF